MSIKNSVIKTLSSVIDADFIDKFNTSASIREFCAKLNVKYGKSAFTIISKRMRELQLPLTKFKVRSFTQEMENEIFIISEKYRSSSTLSRYIRRMKIFPYECSCCKIKEWQNNLLSLHLDHINGNKFDNRIENLRFLCPNCHSQTPTYCRRKS